MRTIPRFNPVGIKVASTGTFACWRHDQGFADIDGATIDWENPTIQSLLSYRAVLREIWTLLKIRPATEYIDRVLPGMQPPSFHPDTRLQSLLFLQKALGASMGWWDSPTTECQLMHMVRTIKSSRPIIAAACASGGSMMAWDTLYQRVASADNLRSSLGVEPYSCHTVAIVPQKDYHVVLFSWLLGSAADSFFIHLEKAQGQELEAAVSAELILFGENWFLNPRAWNGYGTRKQQAILKAYDNFEALNEGRYSWWDKDPKIPWHQYLEIPNRHQLNLFRYDESASRTGR